MLDQLEKPKVRSYSFVLVSRDVAEWVERMLPPKEDG
jgi:hypothetical protein